MASFIVGARRPGEAWRYAPLRFETEAEGQRYLKGIFEHEADVETRCELSGDAPNRWALHPSDDLYDWLAAPKTG